jgi:hypothetical protein
MLTCSFDEIEVVFPLPEDELPADAEEVALPPAPPVAVALPPAPPVAVLLFVIGPVEAVALPPLAVALPPVAFEDEFELLLEFDFEVEVELLFDVLELLLVFVFVLLLVVGVVGLSTHFVPFQVCVDVQSCGPHARTHDAPPSRTARTRITVRRIFIVFLILILLPPRRVQMARSGCCYCGTSIRCRLVLTS